MGGGGANSLNSPNSAGNSDFDGDNNDTNITWTEPTYKTYDDYFADFNITKETITENDLTGNGSATNPYIVHSTKGFLWLSNYSLSKIWLANKYFQLACDIILNDETFDESGSPSGGDGVIYNWQSITSATEASFNGCNYSIVGLYLKTEETSYRGLFYCGSMNIVGLKFENVFIDAKWSSPIGGQNHIIENCEVLSGTIIGADRVGGICSFPLIIKNSNNFATVKVTGLSAAGICAYLKQGGLLEYCENYGTIYGGEKESYISGLCAVSYENTSIKNCQNYGDLFATNQSAGGILARALKNIYISNCVNYGDIVAGRMMGGILGQQDESGITISNCKNFGSIGNTSLFSGEIAGRVLMSCSIINCSAWEGGRKPFIGGVNTEYSSANIEVVDCMYISKNLTSRSVLIGGTVQKENSLFTLNISVKDCVFDIIGDVEIVYFVFSYTKINSLEITNTEIKTNDKRLYLLYGSTKTLIMKNIIVSSSNTREYVFSVMDEGDIVKQIEGLLFVGATKKHYISDDFSGFYVDYKTGKIGLKALSGKGFYQGKVTEEWLESKGFEKKVI